MSKPLVLMLGVLCLLIMGCSKSEMTTNRNSTAPATNKNASKELARSGCQPADQANPGASLQVDSRAVPSIDESLRL